MMIERKFAPGDKWLYLKIYTGVKTADIILEEVIQPLTEYFRQQQSISKWFFVRYNDPNPHLRIRFEINNNEVFDKTKTALQQYVDSGEISNILIDSYQREIERYGQNTIEDVETLFCINSEFTLECLSYNDEEKIMITMFYIDQIFNKIHFSVQEKLSWIKDFNIHFKKEFRADKHLNSQLDKKYRNFKPIFLDFIQSEDFSEERNTIISYIEESAHALQHIIHHNENQSLNIPLKNLFQSIFHMNINRMFISNQRLFEMIIYDYLFRYYKSLAFSSVDDKTSA
ncbi:lantibiotic dehydratase [Chryseobacterium sp. P1-3]|nr:lantibiotic dehydratase [Chryseobacterium sp. P1-3]